MAKVVVWGCGDNALPRGEPLTVAANLAIVAHQDDDLLFMQPGLLDAARAGTGVTIVYVTAGDDARGLEYAMNRYAGLRAAYGFVTGATDAADWVCGWIEIAGHAAEHCRLSSVNLSLVFLGYPDGGRQGQSPTSLLALWEGRLRGADTIAERSAYYDREGLITTLATVIAVTAPQTIHTLEVAATHGDDHADHEIVGALAVVASAGTGIELISSRGYNVGDEPANVDPDRVALAYAAFAHYSACAEGCAPCGQACTSFSPTYASYLARSYPIGIDREVSGLLSNGLLSFEVRFADGVMHVGDRCAVVAPDGAYSLGACAAASPLMYDDEGHLWLARAPADATAMAHLDCLGIVEGEPHATACGGEGAPEWLLAQGAR